jgi:hypothetical protein
LLPSATSKTRRRGASFNKVVCKVGARPTDKLISGLKCFDEDAVAGSPTPATFRIRKHPGI